MLRLNIENKNAIDYDFEMLNILNFLSLYMKMIKFALLKMYAFEIFHLRYIFHQIYKFHRFYLPLNLY